MRIHLLHSPGAVYSGNAYLVLGNANRLEDINTLVDVGTDGSIVRAVTSLGTGVGKKPVDRVVLTHSHFDHVSALGAVREAFPKARLHSGSQNAPVDQRNKPSEIVHLGGLRVTHRETPGHAEDGVTYLVGNWQEDAPHVALVGDAIFAGSIGRGNQSWDLARQKVRDQILSLPLETLICPGHGPLTTVAEEKEHNPFF